MKCLISLLGVAGIVVYAFASNAQTTTVRSGKWSSPSTWLNGIVPNESSGDIIINHDVDIPEDTLLSVDQLTINATLTIEKNAVLTLQNADGPLPDLQVLSGMLEVFGRLACRDSATISGSSASNTFFREGSTYEHQYFSIAGEPPTAWWATTSTLEFTGYLTGKSLSSVRWNQSYGNVVYNCSAQRSGTFVEILGNIQTVKGNFIIRNTGAGVLRITLDRATLTTINIDSNFVIEGSSRVWMSRSGNTRINVRGDFHYRSTATASSYLTTQGTGELIVAGDVLINTVGILRFASSGGGNGTIHVRKNFDLITGTLTVASPGQGKIIADGETTQALNVRGNITSGVNLEIGNSSSVNFAANSKMGGNILVRSGGKMFLPNGVFYFEGNLITEAGAEIFAGQGTLQLTGAANQTINVNGDTIYHTLISKPSGTIVSLASPLRLRGVMTIATPGVTVQSDGKLIILSTTDAATGGGAIAALPSGSHILGDVTVQRFMSGEGRIYRYLSSPVSNCSVAQWQDDFPVTGTFEDPSSGGGLNSTGPSLFFYDETLSIDGWRNYPESGFASENPLVPGKGYSAFIRKANASTTWDVSGLLNQHDFAFDVTYTETTDTLYDGWNLVGNPYPSPIDWDSESGWIRSNVANKIAIRDNGTGTFKYWDGAVGNLNDGIIAMGQAFWIQTIGADPTLFIRESAKSTSPAIFYRVKSDAVDYLEASLASELLSDETFLRLDNNSAPGYDKHDVVKWMNDVLNISFAADSLPLAIDVRNRIAPDLPVSLLMNLVRNPDGSVNPRYFGQYRLSIATSGVFDYERIKLKDHFADSISSVSSDRPYHFEINADRRSYDSNRFTFLIQANAIRDTVVVQFDSLVCDASPDPGLRIMNAHAGIRYDFWVNDRLVESRIAKRDSVLEIILLKEYLRIGRNNTRIVSRNISGVTGETRFVVMKVATIEQPVLVDHGATISSSYEFGDWYLQGEKISEHTSSITPDVSGTYSNEIEINGCITRAEINFFAQGISWRCFPVPASHQVFIAAPQGVYIKQVSILAHSGKIVNQLSFENGSKEITIDTTGLADGVYCAVVNTNETIQTLRFIKRSEQ